MPEINETLEQINAQIESKFEEVGNRMEEKANAAELATARTELAELKEVQKKLTLQMNVASVASGETKSEGDKRVEEYLRKGGSAEKAELKTIYIGDDTNAGYLVRPQIETMIDTYAQEMSPFAAQAETISISSDSMERVDDQTQTTNSNWGTELNSGTAETNLVLAKQIIPVHDLYTKAYLSKNMLEDAPNVETMLAEQVAWAFTAKRNTAFFAGSGTGQPKGFLLNTNIEKASSGAATGLTTDGLIKFVGLLKSVYAPGAVMVMNRATLYQHLFTLEDAEERKYLLPDLRADVAFTFLGYPIMIDPNMPDVAAGAEAIAFGNIRQAYTIVERTGLEVERDIYTQYPLVKFNFRSRVGGDVKIAEAMKLLTIEA